MYIEGGNMAKKITVAGLPIGGPSLLMVFVLVCINIFAAISYTSALRDYKLSEKTAENITQYYSAEVKAYEKLALLNAEFEKNPASMKVVEQYEIPVKKEIVLSVKVLFSKEAMEYNIIEWKLINKHTLEERDTYLDLPEF